MGQYQACQHTHNKIHRKRRKEQTQYLKNKWPSLPKFNKLHESTQLRRHQIRINSKRSTSRYIKIVLPKTKEK